MKIGSAEFIIENYQFHTMLIQRYTDGISHQESEWQLPFPHNCLNWIVGHIAANRSHVLEVVAADHTWMKAVRDRYHQDTPPVTPENPGLDLGKRPAAGFPAGGYPGGRSGSISPTTGVKKPSGPI